MNVENTMAARQDREVEPKDQSKKRKRDERPRKVDQDSRSIIACDPNKKGKRTGLLTNRFQSYTPLNSPDLFFSSSLI